MILHKPGLNSYIKLKSALFGVAGCIFLLFAGGLTIVTSAYNNRGVVYYEQKKWDLAIADFNKAIQINPNYAAAYNNRGLVYYEQKKWDLAIADYNKAIQINLNYALAYTGRGLIWKQLGDKQKAVKDLQTAAQLFQKQGNMTAYQKAMNASAQIQQD